MKKLKLHKTFLGAFAIWTANGLCAPILQYYRSIGCTFIGIVFISLSACSSSHYSHSRARKRADKLTNPVQRQYAFHNNQIIIFENIH